MADLNILQYALIALIFIWSGIVRSGIGFGGAALSLPFILLIDNQPLIYLPIIAIQLLVFSALTVAQSHRTNQDALIQSTVDWRFLRKALLIMIIPKLIGVFGLINFPLDTLNTFIFGIIAFYSLTYIFNIPFNSRTLWLDVVFLMVGAYISGISLIGAPLLVAVFAKHVDRRQLRDTLFVLWFILVSIKLSSFIYAHIDLQLIHQLWLLPCAAIGHWIGLRVHDYLMKTDNVIFYRFIGVILLMTSSIGLLRMWVLV